MDSSAIFIDDGLEEKAKDRYKKRRNDLISQLNCPVLISAIRVMPGQHNAWANIYIPIFQEPLFLYLTGINQPNVYLLLNPHHPTEKETLFVPEKDPHFEFWEGPRFGISDDASIEDIKTITGIEAVHYDDELIDCLTDHVKQHKKITSLGLYWHQSDNKKKLLKDDNYTFKNKVKRELKKANLDHITIENISKTQWEQRLILDRVDQENLRIANKKTTDAFTHTLAILKYCKTETDVMGYLDGHITRSSWYKNSFPSIVASGKNAAILHYTKNNAPLPKNGLLLLDFGVRWHSMNADISRTIPINGTFNPLQKLLYNIVLNAQQKVEDAVKPGVTIYELNEICWTFINNECKKQILKKGGKIARAYDKAPHNVSHFLGLEVHDGDPFRNYRKEPLNVGQVISNEPGFYGEVELKIDGILYSEHLGIRIEDDLLITEDGCENLSKECPKTISELESRIR